MGTDTDKLKKVALNDKHIELGAKMVEFAGYYMPIVYSGIIEEHKCVRTDVGVFDVSHMGEFRLTGDNALDLIQKITINDASSLEIGQVQYSAMCYEEGGIVDDLLVYRQEGYYMLVVNAANLEKDWNWLQENMIDSVDAENISDNISLLAIQGPKAIDFVQELCETDISGVKYYWAIPGTIVGCPALLSRTGYTGENGFEIYLENQYATKVMDAVLEKGTKYNLKPIGLGARDTLRLEKKMALYGNDISKDTNPIEAGLSWITKLDKGEFNGREAIAKIKEEGVTRRLVAFVSQSKAVPRHGYEIAKDGEVVGEVTSGNFSPMLEKGIGLGYVAKEHAKVDTEIMFRARGKENPAVIIKPPFV